MSLTATSDVPLAQPRAGRGVGIWLFVIAGLIGLMVVVGGLVRLTGSGLSITEWQPVTGVIPPLSEADWQAEFAKYQGTPQYELINRSLGPAGFKSIYWWEWTHRLLGRALGIVFLLPFLMFWRQGRIGRSLAMRLSVIFLLGAAQGALGWWMVQSGLEGSRVAVSQYRLAAHLGLAIVLFGYIFWTALETFGAKRTQVRSAHRFYPWAVGLVALVFVQIILGAFMAGLGAGTAFSDWPMYGGRWWPIGLYDLEPWWINHFENPALVHFQHRTAGYILAAFVVGVFVAVGRAGVDNPVRGAADNLILLVLLQAGLGILAVVTMVWLSVATLHQISALILFAAAVHFLYVLTPVEQARATPLSA